MSRLALKPTHPSIHRVPVLYQGVKQPVCEADHLPPHKVRMRGAKFQHHHPTMCLYGMQRDNPCVTKQGIFIMKKALNPELKVDESAKNVPNNKFEHMSAHK